MADDDYEMDGGLVALPFIPIILLNFGVYLVNNVLHKLDFPNEYELI